MVYLWVDGIYVKAGLEKEKAVLLVVQAALSDGSKAVVSVTSGYRESTQSWSEVLRDLKRRGMGCPRLVIGDGHLGIWGALRNVYPQAEEQRCWNHRIVNLLTKLPKRVHKPALLILRQIPYAESREEAQRLKKVFQHWCRQRGLTLAAELIEQDWDRMVTFYLLSKEAVAASANHQSSGVTVCRSSAANGRGQAIQESGKRPGGDLEDAAGGGAAIPPVEGTGADERRLPGRQICQWSPGQPSPGGESHLMFFHTY